MPLTLPTAAGATTEYEDFYETTLQAPLGAADTDIYTVTLPVSAVGFLVIDPLGTNPEVIFYNFKGANFVRVPSAVDGEGRGVFNTTPRPYPAGTKIGMYSIAAFFEGIVTGKFMRDGFLQARHFSSSIDPNSWIGTGETWNYVGSNEQKEFQYVTAGDKTAKYSKGMKVKIPRPTALGTQSAQFVAASSQYAVKAAPSGYVFTTQVTLQAKVFLTGYPAAGNYVIVSKFDGSNGWGLDIDTNGTLTVRGDNGGNEKNGNGKLRVPLNRWVTVTGTLDVSLGANWGQVYHDGVAIPTNQNISGAIVAINQGAAGVQIGARNGATMPFNGQISEVSVWSTVMSQATIIANYNKQLVGNEANLVGYWKLNGNFNDTHANANHLTATNGAIATYADNPFQATEYGIITDLSFAAGNTTITIWCGTDYLAPAENNSGISYSAAEAPVGFPSEAQKWSIKIVIGGTWSGVGTGAIDNPGGLRARVPRGKWRAKGRFGYQTNGVEIVVGLSTNIAAYTDTDVGNRDFFSGSTLRLNTIPLEKNDYNFSALTWIYMLANSNTTWDIRGDNTNKHLSTIEVVSDWI